VFLPARMPPVIGRCAGAATMRDVSVEHCASCHGLGSNEKNAAHRKDRNGKANVRYATY
jgi:hypothetical protein